MLIDEGVMAAQRNWWTPGAEEQWLTANSILIALGVLAAWVVYMGILHYGNRQLKKWDHKQMTDERREILAQNVTETDAGSVLRVLNAVVSTTGKPVRRRKAQLDLEWIKKEYDVR